MGSLDLRDEEREFLAGSERCPACGHLMALHNQHCCDFCKVPDCPCQWGEVPKEADDVGHR